MQLRIEPGCALGPFQLGSTINDVIGAIRRDSIALRDNRLIFNQSDPLAADLIIDVLHLNIRLRFAADTQRETREKREAEQKERERQEGEEGLKVQTGMDGDATEVELAVSDVVSGHGRDEDVGGELVRHVDKG